MALSKIDAAGLDIGQIGGRRNIIINGAMQVAQRGTTGTITDDGQYVSVDRWKSRTFSGSGRFSVAQDSDVPNKTFEYSAKLTVTTTDTSGTNGYSFAHYIEDKNTKQLGFGESGASDATLSFWVKSSITGTYSASLRLHGTNGYPSYVTEYTINSANTWEYKTITISGYTGSTARTHYILDFGLGGQTSKETSVLNTWDEDSNFVFSSNQVDWQSNSGATFYITGVQLEVGSVATPFEHRSFGEEMELCKRYYQKSFDYSTVPAFDASENQIGISMAYNASTATGGAIELGVEMRTTPTVTYYSRNVTTGNYWGMYKNTTWIVTTTGNNGSRSKRIQFYVQPSGAGMTAQNVYELSGNWTAEAEL